MPLFVLHVSMTGMMVANGGFSSKMHGNNTEAITSMWVGFSEVRLKQISSLKNLHQKPDPVLMALAKARTKAYYYYLLIDNYGDVLYNQIS